METTQAESPGKTAHPIELFFDLVYVFGFTRVVGLVVHDHNLTSTLYGALILGLLWWSWGIWTWTMNAVDLTHRYRRVLILIAMIGIFLMGYAIPTAFEGDALWLAAGYVLSRLIAATVMWFGTLDDAIEHEAIRAFLPYSMVAPALVVAGALIGGSALPWIWLAALVAEVGSALASGSSEWHIDAGHFAERHGLILIIALGEAIIAVGIALTAAADEGGASMAIAWRLAIGLVGVSAMWWAYFDKLQVIWERRLDEANAAETGKVARDIYSLGHYPMLTGIVFFAVALEEAFLHPDEPLTGFTRWMLAVSIAIYFLSQAAACRRAWGGIMYERIGGVVVMVLMAALLTAKAELVVLLITIVMIITMTLEYWRLRAEVLANPYLRR